MIDPLLRLFATGKGFLCVLVFIFLSENAFSQVPISQAQTELDALARYESVHPPVAGLPLPGRAVGEERFGSRLVRSVTLLATSTPKRKWPVKILIYGQSIVGSQVFTDEFNRMVHAKFPNAAITVENKAIGGCTADRILRTAAHDVYYADADLIVFHVYGGEEADYLDKLFFNIRKYTTADILLLTHHTDLDSEEMDTNAYAYLQYIANKYSCELVDVSHEWKQYLEDNHLSAADLLRDPVHPNRNGNRLLVDLIERHLRYSSEAYTPWSQQVTSYYLSEAFDNPDSRFSYAQKPWALRGEVACGSSQTDTLRFQFEGNRVDFIAGCVPGGEVRGTATLRVDGHKLSETALYAFTRPSEGPATWWPAVRKVSSQAPLVPETWTLTIDGANADSTAYAFHVTGSSTGDDGAGTSDQFFMSTSKRVVIRPTDFMLNNIRQVFKTRIPTGYEVSWQAKPLFVDPYRAIATPDSTEVYKTTVVQGLNNGPHTLEIIPNGDGVVPIAGIEVHRPMIR